MNYYEPMIPGEMYHVMSRAVGFESIFIEPKNYRFFLQRYKTYINPVADTFAYALLKNHFHFLVEIKPDDSLLPAFFAANDTRKPGNGWQQDLVMQQWSNFLNSYSRSFNNVYGRKGSLFIDRLKRVQVKDDGQFCATVFYIHKNPVHHGFCKNMQDWQWSSYNTMFSSRQTIVQREQVLNFFGGVAEFERYHQQPINLKHAVTLE